MRSEGESANNGYFMDHGYFGAGDADVYYSLIRSLKPQRIVEIGSGHSSRLAATALNKNAQDGQRGTLTCVEPVTRSG